MFNIIAGTLLNISLLYFIPLLFLSWHWKSLWKEEKTRHIILFVLIYFVAALTIWAIFFKEINSSQLFYNLAIPCINLSFIFLFAYALSALNKQVNVFFALGFTSIFWMAAFYKNILYRNHQNDIAYINKSVKLYQKFTTASTASKGKLGVVLMGNGDYSSIFRYYQTSIPGEFLFTADQESKLISLGDYFMTIPLHNPLDSLRKLNGFKMGFFKNYFETVRDSLPTSYNPRVYKAHKDFINAFKIKYGIYTKFYPYKDSIQNMIAAKVSDPISGETFFIIK